MEICWISDKLMTQTEKLKEERKWCFKERLKKAKGKQILITPISMTWPMRSCFNLKKLMVDLFQKVWSRARLLKFPPKLGSRKQTRSYKVINALFAMRISSLQTKLKNCKIAIMLITISVLMSGFKRRRDVLSATKV